MHTTTRLTVAALAALSLAVGAAPKARKVLLTPRRVAELTAPAQAPAAKGYKIDFGGLGIAHVPAAETQSSFTMGREIVFPTEFDPPQAGPVRPGFPLAITPITPTAFERIETGWTVNLKSRARGKMLFVDGEADYVEVQFVPGGYGAIAGPIHTEKGELLTANKLDQPKVQKTTTRFHVFAVPGEPYEITLYRGEKAEKHLLTVSVVEQAERDAKRDEGAAVGE